MSGALGASDLRQAALNPAWLLEPGVEGAWSESLARKLCVAGRTSLYHPPALVKLRPYPLLRAP
jgi:hypothetical protein